MMPQGGAKLGFGRQLLAMLAKEWAVERRSRATVGSLLVYVLSLVFVTALSLRGLVNPLTWNVVFWLIVLFAGLNAMARSFLGERPGQLLYQYQLAGPLPVLLAKMLYSFVLMLLLGLVAWGLYSLLLPVALPLPGVFVLGIVLGALALASSLTLVAAIVNKAGGRASLLAVLAFPLLLPQLLKLVAFTRGALLGVARWQDLQLVLALSGVAVALSVLLFPLLWQDE